MRIHKAFTMIELILVIVVLGIVASISSEIIVQVYKSFIIQKAAHTSSIKSELTINQISNRLLYRIDLSMIARKPGQKGIVEGTDVYPASEVPITGATNVDVFTAMEWIAYENDGFTQSKQPAWSGFTDLTLSNYNSIITTGSKLTNETTILNNLSGGAANNPAILFNTLFYRTANQYKTLCMYQANGCIFPVTISSDTNLSFTGGGDRVTGQMMYSEFYTFAASSYAVVPENNTTVNGITLWELALYSDYQPWLGENYKDHGTRSLLARNVSVFRFKQERNSVRVKICTIARISQTEQISTCKEKSVIR